MTGLSPSRAGDRIVVPLQAFIDDSFDEGGTFVLAGYIATAQTWAKFSACWENALTWATLDSQGNRRFKMAEMASNPERLSRVGAFYRIIEAYDPIAVSCCINIRDLQRAKARLSIPRRDIRWGLWATPFFLTFRTMIDLFHRNRSVFADGLNANEKVDFIFDYRSEKKPILASWDDFIRNTDISDEFGAYPRFENDLEFLPLQAADFLAWWVRRWTNEGHTYGSFPTWQKAKPIRWIQMGAGEEDIVETFKRIILDQGGPGTIVYEFAPNPSVPFSFKSQPT